MPTAGERPGAARAGSFPGEEEPGAAGDGSQVRAESLAVVEVWSAGPMARGGGDTEGAGPGSAAQHPAAPAVLLGCCGPPWPPTPEAAYLNL